MPDEKDLSSQSTITPQVQGILDPSQQGAIGEDEVEANYAVDIVFALDATKSMQGVIDAVKDSIKDLVVGIYQGFQDSQKMLKKLRARVIEYRDMVQDQQLFMEEHPFCELYTSDSDQFNTDSFNKLLDGITAIGGGDLPESTFDAMCRALESDWNEDAVKLRKIVVVITDYASRPLHESTKRTDEEGLSDVDIVLERLSKAMKDNEMRLLLVAPSNAGYDKILNSKYVFHQELNPGGGDTGKFDKKQMETITKWIVASSQN